MNTIIVSVALVVAALIIVYLPRHEITPLQRGFGIHDKWSGDLKICGTKGQAQYCEPISNVNAGPRP